MLRDIDRRSSASLIVLSVFVMFMRLIDTALYSDG